MPEANSALELPGPVPVVSGREMPTEVSDEREYFAKITKETPRDTRAEEAFIASKFHLVKTHPTLDPADREEVLAELTKRIGREPLDALAKEETPPVPGGVGYGFFYLPAFKMAFTTGTGLYWQIVCPTVAGGNVDDFLYLTAMNRAAKGIEAFVSYFQQEEFHFKVFDWSRELGDPWGLDIPFVNLGSYLDTGSAHGSSYQVLGVYNYTFEISPTKWRNEAWLYNVTAARWDLMYSNEYTAAHADQVAAYVGSWGPIVETFQPLYAGTNRYGALNTGLTSRDSSNAWGPWKFLSSNPESSIRSDNVGFSTLFLDPNYAFMVYTV
jgi:hypothetical protein